MRQISILEAKLVLFLIPPRRHAENHTNNPVCKWICICDYKGILILCGSVHVQLFIFLRIFFFFLFLIVNCILFCFIKDWETSFSRRLKINEKKKEVILNFASTDYNFSNNSRNLFLLLLFLLISVFSSKQDSTASYKKNKTLCSRNSLSLEIIPLYFQFKHGLIHATYRFDEVSIRMVFLFFRKIINNWKFPPFKS